MIIERPHSIQTWFWLRENKNVSIFEDKRRRTRTTKRIRSFFESIKFAPYCSTWLVRHLRSSKNNDVYFSFVHRHFVEHDRQQSNKQRGDSTCDSSPSLLSMMSMHFPYGNTNTAGQRSYATAVCPSFGINYNPYFSPAFYSNGNGLLPTPFIPTNRSLNSRECKEFLPTNLLPNSFPMPYGPTSSKNSKDFLTFLEQKSQPIPGLNPFANEFSLGTTPPNGFPSSQQEKPSSYKLIFDDLIEKSLKSIDAIEKAST